MTAAKSLEAWYAALTVGGRLNPERSRALPAQKYGDPAKTVRLGQRKEVTVERMSDKEIADSLLLEWYRWSRQWRPNLGAPRISPTCREYRQDEKHNDETDGYCAVHQKEMEAVEYCVDALAVPLQQAIGTEMRNREVNAKVWRNPANRSYSEALAEIVPVMKKRGLFD